MSDSRERFEALMSVNGQNITKPGSDFYEYQSGFTEQLWDMISARDAEIEALKARVAECETYRGNLNEQI